MCNCVSGFRKHETHCIGNVIEKHRQKTNLYFVFQKNNVDFFPNMSDHFSKQDKNFCKSNQKKKEQKIQSIKAFFSFELFLIVFLSDVDECSEMTSGCQQKCTNSVGSFSCSCYSGYSLMEDGLTCFGSGASAFLKKLQGILYLHGVVTYIFDV